MTAGRDYDITPYGTEAMHVLRAEKGYVIVGQDTDGSVTPVDLGMDWIVSKKKDFIGKRSLSRSDTDRPNRKQLVGLKTQDPSRVLPEGAQQSTRSARLAATLRGRPDGRGHGWPAAARCGSRSSKVNIFSFRKF